MGKIYNEMFEIKKQCDEKMTQLMEEMMAQLQTIDTTKAYNEFDLYCNNLINNEPIVHDQLDIFALGYAYNWVKPQDYRSKVIYYFEKYLSDTIKGGNIYLDYIYNSLGEAYEKEFEFEKAIKYYDLQNKEKLKDFTAPPKVRYKKVCGKKIKYLYYKSNLGEIDVVFPFFQWFNLYLKIGTDFAINYLESLKTHPYFEEDSDFKNQWEHCWVDAYEKKLRGYVYKPQTKIDQAKFLEVAKRNGWR